MRKRRLLLATAALATATVAACKRPIHGNTKGPHYADAGAGSAATDAGSAAPDAADTPKEPEIIHSNPGPSLYDSGHK